jgi:hypothetical protein
MIISAIEWRHAYYTIAMTMITSNMMIGPPRPHRGLRVIQTRHTPARPVRQDLVAVPGAHHGQVVRLADFVADHSRPARPGSWASVLRSASPTRSLESFLYRWATNVDSLGSSVQSIVDPVLAAVGALPSYLEQSLGYALNSNDVAPMAIFVMQRTMSFTMCNISCDNSITILEQRILHTVLNHSKGRLLRPGMRGLPHCPHV